MAMHGQIHIEQNYIFLARFDVLTAVQLNTKVFCNVSLSRWASSLRRFDRFYCSRKTSFLMRWTLVVLRSRIVFSTRSFQTVCRRSVPEMLTIKFTFGSVPVRNHPITIKRDLPVSRRNQICSQNLLFIPRLVVISTLEINHSKFSQTRE